MRCLHAAHYTLIEIITALLNVTQDHKYSVLHQLVSYIETHSFFQSILGALVFRL